MKILRIGLLAGLILVLAGCEKRSEAPEPTEDLTEKAEFPSQEGRNSQLYLTRAGRRQAVLKYGHMRKYDSRKVVLFDEGVEVDFYDSGGNHTSKLTSERGEYHEDTEDVMGIGNVMVVSDSGMTLHTEELRWDNRLEKIYSDTLIMLTTQNLDTLYGIGFESNADLTRRRIFKPWGISSQGVDFDKIESSFARKEATVVDSADGVGMDSPADPDSVSTDTTGAGQ